MKVIEPHGVLAVGTGENGANNFLSSPAGTVLVSICGACAVVVLVSCAFKTFKHFSDGKFGQGFKVIIFCLLTASLLFKLNLALSGVKDMSSVVQKVLDSVGSVTG